jgi:hypothetical protein
MHVLVEGRDDREFFDVTIRPILQVQYDCVQIWEYAGATIEKRIGYLRSVQAMNADYLFVADINTSPCVTARKKRLVDSHKETIDAGRMVIVIREIEGWYLAGLDDKSCKELALEPFSGTDDITKEDFGSLIPKKFASRIDFMAEVLKRFSVGIAGQKNKSFHYFISRIQRDPTGMRFEK